MSKSDGAAIVAGVKSELGEARKKLYAERSKGAKATLRYILPHRFIYGIYGRSSTQSDPMARRRR